MHYKQWQRINAVALQRTYTIFQWKCAFGGVKHTGYRLGSADGKKGEQKTIDRNRNRYPCSLHISTDFPMATANSNYIIPIHPVDCTWQRSTCIHSYNAFYLRSYAQHIDCREVRFRGQSTRYGFIWHLEEVAERTNHRSHSHKWVENSFALLWIDSAFISFLFLFRCLCAYTCGSSHAWRLVRFDGDCHPYAILLVMFKLIVRNVCEMFAICQFRWTRIW